MRRNGWEIGLPALAAAGWLLAYSELVAGRAAGDLLLPVVAVAAVCIGSACPVLLIAWWRSAAGVVAVASILGIGGSMWLVLWIFPIPISIQLLGMACGSLVGAVGMRAHEVGAEAVRPLLVVGLAGASLFIVSMAWPGVADPALVVALAAIGTPMVQLALGIPAIPPGCGSGPRARDVGISVGTFAGAGLVTAALQPVIGEPVVFVMPITLALGAGVAVLWQGRRHDNAVLHMVGTAAVFVIVIGGVTLALDWGRSLHPIWIFVGVLLAGCGIWLLKQLGGLEWIRQRLRR